MLLRTFFLLLFFLMFGCGEGSFEASDPVAVSSQSPSSSWPPVINAAFPPLDFYDRTGQLVGLDSYKGYLVLLEFVRMPNGPEQVSGDSPVNQDEEGVPPQQSKALTRKSPRSLFPEYAGLKETDHRIKHVQILVYGPDNEHTVPRHILQWQSDTGGNGALSPTVLVPKEDLRRESTDNMLGGYLLLDKDGKLRFNAAGPRPPHDLKAELLPALADLAARLSEPTGRYTMEWSQPATADEQTKETVFKAIKPLK